MRKEPASDGRVLLKPDKTTPAILILGESGSGKTVFCYRIMQAYRKRYRAKIFFLDTKDLLEPAYMQFPLNKHQHSIVQGNGEDQFIARYPVRINHPLLKKLKSSASHDDGIPRSAIPETNFYTIPLKSLGDEEVNIITEHFGAKMSNALVMNSLARMSQDDSYYDLMDSILQRVKSRESYSIDEISEGKMFNAGIVKAKFESFVEHGFLRPERYKYNLDIEKLFKEREVVEIISTRYINNKKIRDFLYVWWIKQIMRTAIKNRKPTVIVIDELAQICPARSEGYKKIVNSFMSTFLKEMRNMNIRVVANAQVSRDIGESVQNGFTQTYLGKVNSGNEQQLYAEKFGLRRSDIDKVKHERSGTFMAIGVETRQIIRAQ